MPHFAITPTLLRSIIAIAAMGTGAASAQDSRGDWPSDEELLSQNPGLTAHPTRILVQFEPGMPEQLRVDMLAMVAGETVRTFSLVPGLEAIECGVGAEVAVLTLQGMPFVEFAEFDLIVHPTSTFPNDPGFNSMWGLHNTGQNILGVTGIADSDIDAPEAWDFNTGSASVVIANIDTGTSYTHIDLAANMWINAAEISGNGLDDDGNGFIDDIRGWDFYSNDNDPNDGDGHGTHTAGTIGAVGNNGNGVTGVMWTCKVMPLRFLGPGGGTISGAIGALSYAVNKGVKISNNSWGFTGFSSSMSSAISNAQAAGHLFVAAAGNNNSNNDSFPFYPASYGHSNIISVAGTTNRDLRYSFSNYGVSSVDLGAPAVSVLSTWPGNQYAYLDGTSMASPHVAGVAGLLLAENPGWTYTQIRDRILSTARPIGALAGITVTGGMLNAGAALTPNNQPPARPGQPTCTNLGAGQVRVQWVDNCPNETRWLVQRQQRVSGVWTNTTNVASNLPANTTLYVDTPGTGTWRYRVRVLNPFGWSQFSLWRAINVP